MGSGDTPPGEVSGRATDPATAEAGDVWATTGPDPRAFLHNPHPTSGDRGDPHPWMQIHPWVEAAENRWFRTRELPAGMALQVRGGEQVAR